MAELALRRAASGWARTFDAFSSAAQRARACRASKVEAGHLLG